MSSIEEQALKKDFQMDFTTPLLPSSLASRRHSASLQAASVSASLSKRGEVLTTKPADYESPFNSDKEENTNIMRRDSVSVDDGLSSHFTSVSDRRAIGPSSRYVNLSHQLDPSASHDDNISSREKYKSLTTTQTSFNNTINQNNLSTLSQLMMTPPFQNTTTNNNNYNKFSSNRVKFDRELSDFEAMILRSHEPVMINDSEKEEIEVLGQRGIWLNKAEVQKWRGEIPIEHYSINVDSQPEVITKRSTQTIEYIQELAVRYLRPPTPPAPGEIIITQEANFMTPPAPPLVIRQQPARPVTPEPLVIREAPPQAPPPIGRKIITISGKRLPPAPRKVIIERFAKLPPKPQSVLIERWLPYTETKRRVIFQPAPPDPIILKPRNTIIQWEAPKVEIRKDFKYLGIVKANPADYVARYGSSLKQSHNLPEFVFDIKTPDGLVLAADYKFSPIHELEGDLDALKLINLEQEGLGEYNHYVSSDFNKTGFSYSSNQTKEQYQHELPDHSPPSNSLNNSAAASGLASVSSTTSASALASMNETLAATNNALNELITQIFHTIDRNDSGRIDIEEAEKTLLRLNSRLGRGYGEDDVKAFFGALDTNSDGKISLPEFKKAFLNITNF